MLVENDSEVYRWLIYFRSICFMKIGDLTNTLNDINIAIQLEKDGFGLSKMLNRRGILFLKMKEYSKCLFDYNKAIELKPNKPKYYCNKGVCLSEMGMNIEAIECYNQAIALDPNDSDYYNNKGHDLSKMSMNVEAIECYNIAIALNTNNSDYYHNKADCFFEMKKINKAIKCIDKAIDINPNWDNYERKGFFLQEKNRFNESIYYYTKAINIFNDDDYDFLDYMIEDRKISYFKMKKSLLGINFDVDSLVDDYDKY